jgi:hypothetical protein
MPQGHQAIGPLAKPADRSFPLELETRQCPMANANADFRQTPRVEPTTLDGVPRGLPAGYGVREV